MAQSASVLFGLFTMESARRFLETTPKTGDAHADRLAAQRRLEPKTTEAERLRLRDDLLSQGKLVFPWRFPDGDWPYAKTPTEQIAKDQSTEFDEWLTEITAPIADNHTAVNQVSHRTLFVDRANTSTGATNPIDPRLPW